MTRLLRQALLTCTLVLGVPVLAAAANAPEPVRRIGVYVQPYYASADTPAGHPTVQVGAAYDALLASNAPADIAKARDLIEAKPDLVTPMTMMVLAIRLYDVGMRDDSVFWFYVAKDRTLTLMGVVEEDAIGSAGDAIRAFANLAGPVINSYAFCDIDRQLAVNDQAWRWVAAHPYMTVYLPQLRAKPGDRGTNLAASVAKLQQMADQARAQLSDPDFLNHFKARRAEKDVDAQFCWK